jgi:hypothetical protein
MDNMDMVGIHMDPMEEDRILARKSVMITVFQSHRTIIKALKMLSLELTSGATQLKEPYK